MPTNADRFLDAFKAIESHLREAVGVDGRADFSNLVAQAASENAAVRTHQTRLIRYAWLRNAIVHHANDQRRRAIAEPRLDVVQDIDAIRLAITRPPLLLDVIGGKVTVCLPNDPIVTAARKMADGDYSQLPIYRDGQVIDILTSEAISLWATNQLEAGTALDPNAPVSEVAIVDEDRHFRVVDRKATVIEALDLFDDALQAGRVLHAVFVLRSHQSRSVAGIATITDIPALLSSLRPTRRPRC